MKKIVYTPPQAEMVLLNHYDVIQTSTVPEEPPIKRMATDSNGLPSVAWRE